MLTYDALNRLAQGAGFTKTAPLSVRKLSLLDEVRQMCESCNAYGTRWSCPPGCGTLPECRERVAGYTLGLLVQTVGQLEDALDGEGMMAAEATHKQSFEILHRQILPLYPRLLALGTGGCRLCEHCTYPDAPCRFPERMTPSMEAYGILVLQACKDSGLPYYYGPGTISYTGCFLLE